MEVNIMAKKTEIVMDEYIDAAGPIFQRRRLNSCAHPLRPLLPAAPPYRERPVG